jgi:hypothetical protein
VKEWTVTVNAVEDGKMKVRDRILVYLATRGSRCATLYEILDILIASKALNTKNPKAYTLKLLSRMARRGQIKRSWIKVGHRKKRLYCLRTAWV